MKKITEKQFDIIGHTIGINVYNSKLSKFKEDKTLPDDFFRNYYNYGDLDSKDPDFLADLSPFIDKWKQTNLKYFRINELGIKLFREKFKKEITDTFVPLSRSKQRYQDYLRADTGFSFSEYLGIKPKKRIIT